MVGVEAEGVVVGPHARHERKRVRAVAVAVLGRTPRQVADAVLRLVVHRQAEERLRVDVDIDLRQTARQGIELVEPARDLRAEGEVVLQMLPEHAAVRVGDELALTVEHLRADEVVAEVRVGVDRAGDAHHVALGRLPAVREADLVAVAVDVAAPVVAVPAVGVAVQVGRVLVPGVVHVELAGAEVAEVPVEVLADGHALLVAEVEARRGAKPPGRLLVLGVAEEVVGVPRQEVGTPPPRVAGHPAEAAVGVERIVEVGQPEDRHLVEAQPGVPEAHIFVLAVLDLARHVPVGVAHGVRARRAAGRVAEEHEPVDVAGHGLAPDGHGPVRGDDVARRGERLGDVVGRDAVGGEGHRLSGGKEEWRNHDWE